MLDEGLVQEVGAPEPDLLDDADIVELSSPGRAGVDSSRTAISETPLPDLPLPEPPPPDRSRRPATAPVAAAPPVVPVHEGTDPDIPLPPLPPAPGLPASTAPSLPPPDSPLMARTLIGRPEEQVEKVGRLVVMSGPGRGAYLDLRGKVWSVGRGPDNDLVVEDARMSRRHLEFFLEPEGLAVRDLGSGNGTRVNGHPIDCVYVGDGDLVDAGDSVFRVQEGEDATGPIDLDALAHGAASSREAAAAAAVLAVTGDAVEGAVDLPPPPSKTGEVVIAPPASREPSVRSAARRPARPAVGAGRRQRFVLYGVLGVVMVLGFGVGFILKQRRDAARAREAASVPPDSELAERAFREGVDLFRREAWDRAAAKFEVARQLLPDNDRIRAYVEATRKEAEAKGVLGEARALLDRGATDEAAARLRTIGEDSTYSEQARALLAEAGASRSAVKEGVAAARRALERDDLDGAAAEIDAVLAKAPGDAEALDVKARVAAARAGPSGRAATASAPTSARRSDRRRGTGPAAGGRTSPEPSRRGGARGESGGGGGAPATGAAAEALRQFKAGKASEAIKVLEAAGDGGGAATLLANLKAFGEAFLEGQRAAQAKQADAAIKQLERALELERKIAAGQSPYAASIKTRLADMHYIRGRFAYGRQQFPEAYDAWSQAVRYQADHDYSRKGLDDLSKKAQKLYYEGYVVRNFDPKAAREKWVLVTRITPPGNEWHIKAKERLQG
jgi:pSer/pThr/pTyr-binding forkhead associated (FHA) protein